MTTARGVPRAKRRPRPNSDPMQAILDKMAVAVESFQASVRAAPHHTVMVRLTYAEVREKLEAALATTRTSLADAEAALAAALAGPEEAPGQPRVGPPPAFYERSWRNSCAERVAYLEFVLKHQAPGDIVADGAHLNALLSVPTAPAGMTAPGRVSFEAR